MRITLVTPLYPPDLGKLATYTKTLATELAKRAHTVHLVTYNELPELVPGVRITAVSKQLPLVIRLVTFTFRLWQESRRMDALYVGDGASVGVPALLVGWLRGIPVTRFMLDDEARERAERDLYIGIPEETFALLRDLDTKTRFIRSLQNWVLRRAKQTFLPSNYFQDILERAYHLPSTKMAAIPFPIEAAQRLPFSAERKPLQIFTHSPLNFFSGVEELLSSVAILRKTLPEIRLIIANTGPEVDRLKQRSVDLGISDAVEFIGRISQAEFSYLLNTSSVFVRNQTSANTADEIYQAYAAGIPVVASRIACHTEAIHDQVSGILIEPNAAPDLTQALLQLLQGPIFAAQLVQGGQQLLGKRGGWDEHIQRLLASL